MLIKGTTLKEKKIIVNTFNPEKIMHINVDRVNSMPPSVQKKSDFNCILEYSVKITNDAKINLVEMKIAYLILVQIEEDEEYNQENIGDKLFTSLEPMYIKAINDMLKETAFPAVPLNLHR